MNDCLRLSVKSIHLQPESTVAAALDLPFPKNSPNWWEETWTLSQNSGKVRPLLSISLPLFLNSFQAIEPKRHHGMVIAIYSTVGRSPEKFLKIISPLLASHVTRQALLKRCAKFRNWLYWPSQNSMNYRMNSKILWRKWIQSSKLQCVDFDPQTRSEQNLDLTWSSLVTSSETLLGTSLSSSWSLERPCNNRIDESSSSE